MKDKSHIQLLSKFTPEYILSTLSPFILEQRQDRIQSVLSDRLDSIHLVLESPSDIHNAMAAIRSAEAFGVVNVHIINPDSPAVHAKCITQGAFYWVNTIYHENLQSFLNTLPQSPFCLAGAQMEASTPLCQTPIDQPLYLMLGNENRGLSQQALDSCDIHYKIPMNGMSESLNLSVSAAISLYDTTARKRVALKGAMDMTEEKHQQLKAQYYLNSINQKLLKGLFKQS